MQDQCPQFGIARLDVLVVQQHIRTGHRRAGGQHRRDRALCLVLDHALGRLVPQRLQDSDLVVIRHLQQVEA
jgi:hypothetical protein